MGQALRVISLVPSLTELLAWLGAGDRLVGRTRYCTAPAGEIEHVTVVGGTKDPQLGAILGLRPDVVVANREENRREDVEAMMSAGLDVLVTDPVDVAGALEVIRQLGTLLDADGRAADLARETQAALAEAIPVGRRVCVLLWKAPWMALGSGTYGHDLLERCGAVNVFADRERYPEVNEADVAARGPQLILLPDEPYHFRPRDAAAWAPTAPARIVDGRLLWWYGLRMPAAIRALRGMFAEEPP